MLPAHGTLTNAILHVLQPENGMHWGQDKTHAFGRPVRLVREMYREVDGATEAATRDA